MSPVGIIVNSTFPSDGKSQYLMICSLPMAVEELTVPDVFSYVKLVAFIGRLKFSLMAPLLGTLFSPIVLPVFPVYSVPFIVSLFNVGASEGVLNMNLIG